MKSTIINETEPNRKITKLVIKKKTTYSKRRFNNLLFDLFVDFIYNFLLITK